MTDESISQPASTGAVKTGPAEGSFELDLGLDEHGFPVSTGAVAMPGPETRTTEHQVDDHGQPLASVAFPTPGPQTVTAGGMEHATEVVTHGHHPAPASNAEADTKPVKGVEKKIVRPKPAARRSPAR
jgi:hypothetical protein